MNSKVIKSMFMLVISLIFTSLCITFAWFTGIRVQNVGGSGIQLGNLVGELYTFKGNYEYELDQNGSESLSGSPGYSNSSDPFDINSITDVNSVFTKFDSTSFKMDGAKPSSRYLFVIKAKSNHAMNVNIRLTIDDWLSDARTGVTVTGNPSKNSVALTEAMNMYTNTELMPSALIGASLTPEDGNLTVQDAKATLTWANKLLLDKSGGTPQGNITPVDKFTSEAIDNKNGKPINIGSWSQVPNAQYYLFPFIVEFSNEKETYYKFISENEYKKYDPSVTNIAGYNSNIYSGLTFKIIQMSLTQLDEVTTDPVSN